MEIKRDRYLDRLIARKWNGSVKVVTGMRRCGKSYLLFKLFRDHLISEGVPESNIICISLDDISNRHLRDPVVLYEHVVSELESTTDHVMLSSMRYNTSMVSSTPSTDCVTSIM